MTVSRGDQITVDTYIPNIEKTSIINKNQICLIDI